MRARSALGDEENGRYALATKRLSRIAEVAPGAQVGDAVHRVEAERGDRPRSSAGAATAIDDVATRLTLHEPDQRLEPDRNVDLVGFGARPGERSRPAEVAEHGGADELGAARKDVAGVQGIGEGAMEGGLVVSDREVTCERCQRVARGIVDGFAGELEGAEEVGAKRARPEPQGFGAKPVQIAAGAVRDHRGVTKKRVEIAPDLGDLRGTTDGGVVDAGDARDDLGDRLAGVDERMETRAWDNLALRVEAETNGADLDDAVVAPSHAGGLEIEGDPVDVGEAGGPQLEEAVLRGRRRGRAGLIRHAGMTAQSQAVHRGLGREPCLDATGSQARAASFRFAVSLAPVMLTWFIGRLGSPSRWA